MCRKYIHDPGICERVNTPAPVSCTSFLGMGEKLVRNCAVQGLPSLDVRCEWAVDGNIDNPAYSHLLISIENWPKTSVTTPLRSD